MRQAGSMSVAEAELHEAAQATLHMKGIQALLGEMVGCELTVCYICGQRQLADLPTKLHSKLRLSELMNLWGFIGGPLARISDKVKIATVLCYLVALNAVPVEAADVALGERNVSLAGWDELTLVTVLVCIAAVGIWEFFKRAVAWMLGIKEETAKERRLRRLREVARTAAQEELDREYLKREIEVEAETLRWPLKATASDPAPVRPLVTMRTSATQTPPLAEPQPRVETRVVYQNAPIPEDVPVGQFWKTTDHRDSVQRRSAEASLQHA
eukprot:s1140_g11.t1